MRERRKPLLALNPTVAESRYGTEAHGTLMAHPSVHSSMSQRPCPARFSTLGVLQATH